MLGGGINENHNENENLFSGQSYLRPTKPAIALITSKLCKIVQIIDF